MGRTTAEWQKLAYECARSKGFHDCRECAGLGYKNGKTDLCCACDGTGLAPMTPTRIGAMLALIHREISEATECVARGRMELRWEAAVPMPFEIEGGDFHREIFAKGWRPEGFGIELADVFLRLCDLAESLGVKMGDQPPFSVRVLNTPEQMANALNDLHGHVACVSHDEPFEVQRVLNGVRELAACAGVDLFDMAELKHAYDLSSTVKGR